MEDNPIKAYIRENSQRHLDDLYSLLRIPSISSQPAHESDMWTCAKQYARLLEEVGAEHVQVFATEKHPVVFAEKQIDPNLPTILVYGHYDVQPAEPLDLWISKPFEPEIRNGAIYARGANDDKGQSFMHLKAFEYMLTQNKLACNIKFLLEGEEEIGSPSLAPWAKDHLELLACDLILVSDTTMLGEKVPSINCGMRGLSYLEIKVIGPNRDLHSGHYGGAVANPINILCEMIASLTDKTGKITIKDFYREVLDLSENDRIMLAKAPFDEKDFMASLDIQDVKGEEGYTTLERIGIRPSLDVCGIWGGYTGVGAKTVLPSYAQAKLSMRLVPNQDYKKITELVVNHLHAIAPKYVQVETQTEHGGQGFLTPISSPMYRAAAKAIKKVYGIEPVPSRGGGSIPVLADLEQLLKATPLLMGFGLERDTIHSPNESFLLSQFQKGIEAIILFYEYFTEQ